MDKTLNQQAEQSPNTGRIGKAQFIKGIFAGVTIDIFGGFIAEFVLSVACLLIYVLITGMPEGSIADQVGTISNNPILLFFSLISRFLVPFIAGYVCARVAKKEIYKCAIVVGIITFAIGVLIGGTAASSNALLKSLLRNSISFALILFGAHIYGQKLNIGVQGTPQTPRRP